LSEEKTRIVHLQEGYDFLGFTIRHYPNSTRPSGETLLIKPSAKAITALKTKLKEHWLLLRGQAIGTVLKTLNPVIRGWANYFRIGVTTRTFQALDNW